MRNARANRDDAARTTHARGLLVVLLSSIAIAVTVTSIVAYSNNALIVHPEWILGKELAANPLMGSGSAFSTRNLLNRNRLNLSVWHGYQELLLNRIFQPGRIRYEFNLDDDGYLYVIFNRNAGGYAGIRISRNARFASRFFRATHRGEFTETVAIDAPPITADWHSAELEFAPSFVTLMIDGARAGQFDISTMPEQVIGFRSGKAAVLVDDVTVTDHTGRVVLDESFSNNSGYVRFGTVTFAIVLACALLLYAVGRRTKQPARTSFAITTFGIVLVVVLSIYYVFDFLHWSAQYAYEQTPSWWRLDIRDHELGFERARATVFAQAPWLGTSDSAYDHRPESLIRFLDLDADLSRQVTALSVSTTAAGGNRTEAMQSNQRAINNFLIRAPTSDVPRILILGTSQTWGEGANRAHERMVASTHQLLEDRHGLSAVVINASHQGSYAGELLARYRDHLHLFKPTLTVLNLSNNEEDLDRFERNLQDTIDLNRRLGAVTLCVMEANSPEEHPARLRQRHDVLSRVASRNDVALIDLHGYLSRPDVYDSGIMWWDNIHLTSCGQARAAQFLALHIAELLGQPR